MAGGSGHKSKPCEEAKGLDCTCDCSGALHRSWILRVAVAGKNPDREPPDTPWPVEKFTDHLTEIFGSAFETVTDPVAPGSGERVRASRDKKSAPAWPTLAGVVPADHQVQNRIVDVALHELLRNVFELGLEAKPRWIEAVDALTLRKPEGQHAVLSRELGQMTDPKPERGGTPMSVRERNARKQDRDSYFWSSMLAALCAVAIEDSEVGDAEVLSPVFRAIFDVPLVDIQGLGGEQLAAHILAREIVRDRLAQAIQAAVAADQVFSAVCYPARSKPISIAYMVKDPQEPDSVAVSDAVVAASKHVADAVQSVADRQIAATDCLFVARMIGAASSLDLRDHPAAVRYLLLPAIREVRRRHSDASGATAQFSLDATGETIEALIYDKLAAPWHKNENWGTTSDNLADEAKERKLVADKERARQQARDRRTAAKGLPSRVDELEQLVRSLADRLSRLEGLHTQGAPD